MRNSAGLHPFSKGVEWYTKSAINGSWFLFRSVLIILTVCFASPLA